MTGAEESISTGWRLPGGVQRSRLRLDAPRIQRKVAGRTLRVLPDATRGFDFMERPGIFPGFERRTPAVHDAPDSLYAYVVEDLRIDK